MSGLSISLFGRFCARRDGQPLPGLDAYKVQELICYLLLHRDRPHRLDCHQPTACWN